MPKKKYKPIVWSEESGKPIMKSQTLKTINVNYKSMFYAVLSLAIILALTLIVFIVLSKGNTSVVSSNDTNIESVLGKSYVELGKKEIATDPDDPTLNISYWTWTDRNGAWGYTTEVPISGYPTVLLVADSNLKIIKLQPEAEFSAAGADRRADYKEALDRYEGRSLLEFTYFESAVVEGETRIFREMLRDGVAQYLKILYVKLNGIEQFNSTFPQGIKFAKVGTILNAWKTIDDGGIELSDSYYRGKKYVIFATSSCGSCINSVMDAAQRLQTTNGFSKDQIIVIFTSPKDKVDILKGRITGEHLVFDLDLRGVGKELQLQEPPSMMLVDSEGAVFAKEPSVRLQDPLNVDKILQMYQEAK